MSIGSQIRNYRLKRSARQEELAAYVGVSAQAVSKWETNASVPDVMLLPRIAVFLGISIDELFQLSDEEKLERIRNAVFTEHLPDETAFRENCIFLEGRGDAESYVLLARLHLLRARRDRWTAAEYAKQAAGDSEQGHDAWSALVEALGGVIGDGYLDNHCEIIEYARTFAAGHPDSRYAASVLALNLVADRRYAEAIEAIDRLEKIEGCEAQAKMLRGDISLQSGNREEACAQWDTARDAHSDCWQIWCDHADRMRDIGRHAEALSDYEKCYTMQTPPRLLDGLLSRAQLLEQTGDYRAAAEEHIRIIEALKTDFDTTDGGAVEAHESAARRLMKLASALDKGES